MPIDAGHLLQDLKRRVRILEDDLRERGDSDPAIRAELEDEYRKGRDAGRIGDAFEVWREGVLTQAAVHWVLGCVFIRFLEDNELIDPLLSGPGTRAREAADRYTLYFQHPEHRTHNDRHYLEHAFATVAALPTGDRLFDRAHNPIWSFPISADAAKDLLRFWREQDPDTGGLVHDFADPAWDTRFLGDLYQDLSEAAKKTYALLQTPVFVEEFILDRTLGPALREFGLPEVRMIDPTCGSGHFLLGGFKRLLREWQRTEPGTLERELVQRALDQVYGVDINPFAVAIARFRLLIAALRASQVTRLTQAPDFKIHVATGDSLLFGTLRDDELALGGTAAELKVLGFAFHSEDGEEADRILSQRYHAVVGNPPYITVKDKALNQLYRHLYPTCHMKYALSVPFIERFWQLALPASTTRPAGFVGMINANSFMKREFGKKVVEEFFPRVDLTHVIDTSGAYIPGHGTPTVILFGRNRSPIGDTVRAVMGIKGEPGTPENPAQGKVWSAIVAQVNQPGSESEFVSVADSPREFFSKHPWSIGGGGAAELKECIDSAALTQLNTVADSIGFMAIAGEDELFIGNEATFRRVDAPLRPLATGDAVRDWSITSSERTYFPYDPQLKPIAPTDGSRLYRHLWLFRTPLRNRLMFGKLPEDAGVEWYEPRFIAQDRVRASHVIGFAEVSTHNHFALDRGGKVFNRTAPVIKLSADATEEDHLALLGLLNSSTACFWLKQVCFPKGGDQVGGAGARVRKTLWDDRYAFNATNVGQYPVSAERPLDLAARLDALAQERQRHLPDALADQLPMSRSEWERHRAEADRLLREMIALQEELDWRCYRIYGITDNEHTYRDAHGRPLTPPEVELGERAFEIVLARRMARSEENSTWFERHGSTPITEIPSHWPSDYRALVERRIRLIEQDRYVGLIERPEYKRRWNVEPWDEQARRALERWLLDRLETAAYWPEPRLQTARVLADRAARDADFVAVAELYEGHAGVDVHALVRRLAEAEAVPFLPQLRYKASGLRKRKVWEEVWDLQRREDEIDAQVAAELKPFEGETEGAFRERLEAEQKRRKAEEVGDIPRPPKYTSADFVNATFRRLRGPLDVPKECFISYPYCSKDGDPSPLLGWAGWDHLQQAQALATWINELIEEEGWPAERLIPALAGLAELLPWLEQWHEEPDPEFGRLDHFYRNYLMGRLHELGLSLSDLAEWEPPKAKRGRRKKVKR